MHVEIKRRLPSWSCWIAWPALLLLLSSTSPSPPSSPPPSPEPLLRLPLTSPSSSMPRRLSHSSSTAWRRQLGNRQRALRRYQSTENDGADYPSVAIIGGGISGLFCARRLDELGIRPVVFDTGRRGPGGRASNRIFENGYTVDHACQFFTAQTPRFQQYVEKWLSGGISNTTDSNRDSRFLQKCFEGANSLGVITLHNASSSYKFDPLPPANAKQLRLTGVGGMGGLAEGIADSLPRLVKDTWVAKVQLDQHDDEDIKELNRQYGNWHVFSDSRGKRELCRDENFGFLVISHCGKCAERLTKEDRKRQQQQNDARSHPLRFINKVLRARFGPRRTQPKHLLQIQSMYALCVAINTESLPKNLDFQGAFVENDAILSWVCDNTQKYSEEHKGKLRVFTLMSTYEYAAKNKVPQEAIPDGMREKVTKEMLGRFQRILNSLYNLRDRGDEDSEEEHSFDISQAHLQLWGAAQPSNVYRDPCVVDPISMAGICGDWMVAPSIEGAALSGITLADAIAETYKLKFQDKLPDDKLRSIGMYPSTEPSALFVPFNRAKRTQGCEKKHEDLEDIQTLDSYPAKSPVGAFGSDWKAALIRASGTLERLWQPLDTASLVHNEVPTRRVQHSKLHRNDRKSRRQ